MQFRPGRLAGLVVIEPRVFADDRGFFQELFHQGRFAEAGLHVDFVQDNLSRSKANVVRGLHYQIEQPQGKLVRALRGEIFDVAVDLRRSSPTFGQWEGFQLSEENQLAVYIPPGFAHGFCVLSDTADVLYKCTALYAPQHERTLLWNDPTVNVDWPLAKPAIVSGKDLAGRAFGDAETFS
jgi:dTDP-4-dehydrorhamnose 3,5-epimerase